MYTTYVKIRTRTDTCTVLRSWLSSRYLLSFNWMSWDRIMHSALFFSQRFERNNYNKLIFAWFIFSFQQCQEWAPLILDMHNGLIRVLLFSCLHFIRVKTWLRFAFDLCEDLIRVILCFMWWFDYCEDLTIVRTWFMW